MADKTPRSPAFQPPPSRAMARRQIIVGGAATVIGGAACAWGAWSIGLTFALVGPLLLGLGLYLRTSGEAAQVVNAAYDEMSRGHLAKAEELLDHAETTFRLGYIQRIIDLHRAAIAMRRGEIAAALARTDAALARPLGLLTRGQERVHTATGHAARAVLRASSGDAAGARADIAAVRESHDALPDALARAELAEAILLERAGTRDALREHLVRRRRLLLEYTPPRERAIVRAYQRMLEAPRSTVYRQSAPRDPAPTRGDEPAVADWIAKIAPGAAPFATARSAGGERGEVAAFPGSAVDPAARRAAEARFDAKGVPRRTLGRALLGWVLLIVMFFAIWQFLAPDRPIEIEPARAFDGLLATIPVALGTFALIAGLLAFVVVRARKHTKRLFAASAALAGGDDERAEGELNALCQSPAFLVAGSAHLALAVLADCRADFPAALALCERALPVLTRTEATRVAGSLLLAEIFAERAFLLAAMDRHAEASAEMALLAEKYPTHPLRARAELRVGLVQRVRRGDLEGAARLVEGASDDLALSLRDELLADLVRAAVRPESAGGGEIERLRADLRTDAEARRWLEAVAPQVLAAFARAGQEGAAPAPDEAAGRDAEAEREAEAEEDARRLGDRTNEVVLR